MLSPRTSDSSVASADLAFSITKPEAAAWPPPPNAAAMRALVDDLREKVAAIELGGDQDRGLGSGHVQGFIPLWLLKSFGPWTTSGGGGYWFNPGKDNHDWGFIGWELQRRGFDFLAFGGGGFFGKSREKGGETRTVEKFLGV